MPGMPVEKDFPIKEACALYILLDRRLKHRAPKLTKQEEKKLDTQLAMYKRDYFSDHFGDGGYLAHMNKYEDDAGESMADRLDTKYGTNLVLAWTSTDTKSATDLANRIRGEYRDETEGGDETIKVADETWHSILAFEVRHRIVAERSISCAKSSGKTRPSGDTGE